MKKLISSFLAIVLFFTLYPGIYADAKGSKVTILVAKYKNLSVLSSPESENYNNDIILFSFQVGSKYGIVDKDGKIIAKAVYDDIWDYYQGYVVVVKDDKIGYIDNTGKQITEVKYDKYPLNFHEGLAAVHKDDKWGFVDTTGKEVISLQYDDAFNFVDGVAPVCVDGKWGLINTTGKEILAPKYAQIGYIAEGPGTRYSFSGGIAQVKTMDGKWGYIDKTGKEVVETKYDAAWDYRDGFAPFELNGKLGLANTNGIVLMPTYDYIYDFGDNDVTFFVQDGKLGLINREMVVLTEAIYDGAGEIKNSGLIAVKRNNQYGYINLQGKEVIEPQYNAVGTFYNNMAAVNIKGKIGYINTNNKLVIPAKLSNGEYNPNFNLGTAIAIVNKKYGIINQKGKFIVKASYQSIEKDNFDQLYIVKKNGKYGAISKNGKVILKANYSNIFTSKNLICATQNNATTLFDLNGKKLETKTFNSIDSGSFISDKCVVFIYGTESKKGAIINNFE